MYAFLPLLGCNILPFVCLKGMNIKLLGFVRIADRRLVDSYMTAT